MIIATNRMSYSCDTFEKYNKLTGYSHSFLKGQRNGIAQQIEETENMRRGTLVDKILTEPESVTMLEPQYLECHFIAERIKEKFGVFINRLEKQVALTANFEFEGFSLPVRGRVDFALPGYCILDLKITSSKDYKAIIEHFGYINQLYGYAKMYGVPSAYLLMYSVPLKEVKLIKLDVSQPINQFWAHAILEFGTAV